MKLKKKERTTFCIFVVILLLLGMYSCIGTDSSFSYSSSNSMVSSICTVEKFPKWEEVCTNDMLRNDNTMYLCSNVKKSFSKILFGVAFLTCVVAWGLQYLFYLKKARCWEYVYKLTTHVFNISYIHKQDGEK